MKRTSINLKQSQKDALKEHHKKTGILPAEAVRRAIDLYLKLNDKTSGKDKRK
ncbi:MAG: ribbon-helix-helix domain-containing protein [Desulfobacteraceae bacterium]|nr:ribbon-helix-helix domain-containing protein [Desulfobacteraceae bacterium]